VGNSSSSSSMRPQGTGRSRRKSAFGEWSDAMQYTSFWDSFVLLVHQYNHSVFTRCSTSRLAPWTQFTGSQTCGPYLCR
jgi:hypothetical protein